MHDTHVQPLQRILRAINIVSPTAFSFAGQVFDGQMFPAAAPAQPPAQPQRPLVGQLQQALYMYTYVQRFDGTLRTPSLVFSPADDVTEGLSKANASRERWDAGWQIVQVAPSGQVLIQKNGATRTLWPGEFITQDGPGAPPRPGAMVSVYSPRESRTMQPSYYFAFGEVASETQDIFEAVRFYWNVDARGAPELMQALSRSLNRFRTPFRLKCVTYRPLFYRLDSAVLYVNRRHYHIAAELIADVYPTLRSHLLPDTPIFTRRLAPGLAFAEEPGNGESFGMFCCRVVAEGLWSAAMQGAQSVEARLDAVKQQFESNGIDFARPYLRSGSVDAYEFPRY